MTCNTDPSTSPFNARMLSKSLETLTLRTERHSASALVRRVHSKAIPRCRACVTRFFKVTRNTPSLKNK